MKLECKIEDLKNGISQVEKVTGKILKQKDQRILIEKAVKEFKS